MNLDSHWNISNILISNCVSNENIVVRMSFYIPFCKLDAMKTSSEFEGAVFHFTRAQNMTKVMSV